MLPHPLAAETMILADIALGDRIVENTANVLYVGMEYQVDPDVCIVDLQHDDRLLLCSDGLTGMVPDRSISKMLASYPDCTSACHHLADAASVQAATTISRCSLSECEERASHLDPTHVARQSV